MDSNRLVDVTEGDGMVLSRRRFLSVSAAVGGGLLIGFTVRRLIADADAAETAAGGSFTIYCDRDAIWPEPWHRQSPAVDPNC